MIKLLLITAGTVSLLIGITGIFVPVLPTTPFFIITAGLYIRSSDRLYKWFCESRMARSYLSVKRESINPALIFAAMGIMWITIILTIILAKNKPVITVLLIATGMAGTIVKSGILYRYYKNIKQSNDQTINKYNHEEQETDNSIRQTIFRE